MTRFAIATLCILCSSKMIAQVLYPNDLTVTGQDLISGNIKTYYPTTIISPGDHPVLNYEIIHEDADVEFVAGNEVVLKDGFTAKEFNNGQFIARTEPIQLYVLESPYAGIDANQNVRVKKWEKFECAFSLPREYTDAINRFFTRYYNYDGLGVPVNPLTDLNPYADDSLKIEVIFNSPTGNQHIKWGFFMKMGRYDSSGNPTAELEEDVDNLLNNYKWRIRFAPDEESTNVAWSFSVNISNPQGLPGFPSYTYNGFQFFCDPPLPDNKGFLNLNTNNSRFLQFDNGDGFFGIGNNMADHRHCGSTSVPACTTFIYNYLHLKQDFDNYINTIDQMHEVGANYVRMWLIKFDYAPEFDNLGVYDQYSTFSTCGNISWSALNGNRQWQLWALDQIFDKLRQNQIYAQLVVEPFPPIVGYETYLWGNNIYLHHYVSDYNGGTTPSFTVEDFFTDIDNYYYWKRRYKYLLSRYGYSINLAALETVNEIDQVFGFHCNENPEDALCNAHKHDWPENTLLKTRISNWHSALLNYIRNPNAMGGLGESKHLLTISFGDWGSNPQYYNCSNCSCSPNEIYIDQFYDLWSHPLIDFIDVHNYNPDYWGHSYRWHLLNGDVTKHALNGNILPHNTSSSLNLRQAINKPAHFGEGADIWYYNPPFGNGIEISHYYNNYDLAFHNEIWSTAFTGSFTTLNSFMYELIFRWPNGNPNPPGYLPSNPFAPNDLGETFVFTALGVSEEIKSYYHNYKRLSQFININEIDFNIDYEAKHYFDDAQKLECYYLTNESSAYGWIHNLNAFMGNRFLYNLSIHNYTGCNVPSITGPMNLSGFIPNTAYYVSYFYTRMGSEPILFPSSQHLTTDANGVLSVPVSVLSYLGCDSVNADFAFSAIAEPQLRTTSTVANNKRTDTINKKVNPATGFEFSISPNPSYGTFDLLFKGIDVNNSLIKITLYDLTGRIVYQKESDKQVAVWLDLKTISKGTYYIEAINADNKKSKRIVIL